MAIYTKRGDSGKTSLFESKRQVRKDSQRITAVGSLDELSSCLGLAASLIEDRVRVKETMISIQKDLFEIAAEVATSDSSESPYKCKPEKTRRLEDSIDELEGRLPVLANFIFPGGSPAGAALHLARGVCRRLEREVVRLSHVWKVNPEILRYLNRLSDALFVLAREVNKINKSPERVWKG